MLTALSLSAYAGAITGKASVPPAPADDGWWFRLAPYAWVTATEGDLGLAGLVAPVDIGFDDTLDEPGEFRSEEGPR